MFVMTFEFVFIYRHIYRKSVFLVDSKCRNTVILTGLTYTSSRKVFYDGCAKGGIFSHQILNKNSLSLAHCALNRTFTIFQKFEECLCGVYFHKQVCEKKIDIVGNTAKVKFDSQCRSQSSCETRRNGRQDDWIPDNLCYMKSYQEWHEEDDYDRCYM